jgi:predicted MFS family arabinose efflux permease
MRLGLNPDFNKLWAAQAISAFGSNITREALSYAAVLTMVASPMDLSLLSLARAVPVLLLGLFLGVWVDRLPRRPLLIAADLGRAAILLTIPVAAALNSLELWHLYVVAGLTAALTLIFDVADRSYLPSIVPRDKLMEANSRLGLTGSLSEVGGPAFTGLLVQVISAPLVLVLDVVSFLWSAIWLGMIRTPESRHAPEAGHEAHNIWRETREGLSTLWRNLTLRTLAGASLLHSFFGWFFGTLYIFFEVRELGLSSVWIGILISAGGVGALIGAASANALARRLGLGRMLVVIGFVIPLCALLTPLASGPFALVIAALLVSQLLGDIAWEVYFIGENSLRQMTVAPRFIGRVTATNQFLTGGAGPLGAVVAGALATATSARFTLFVAVGGFLLAALWLAFSPLGKMREPSHPDLAG